MGQESPASPVRDDPDRGPGGVDRRGGLRL